MVGEYPATLSYLKLLLTNVADLTEVVDADLANPQFLADLTAFRNGERAEPPEGQTLAVLARLAGDEAKRELSELGESASQECRNRGWVADLLSAACAGVNATYQALRSNCELELKAGALDSLPRYLAFWDLMLLSRFMEQSKMAGPLRTNRRPRCPTDDETAGVLLARLQGYSESWRWERLHNEQVISIQQMEKCRPTYKSGMTHEQEKDFAHANAMIIYEKAIHFRDSLAEYEIGRLLREVCPQLLEYLPPDIPKYTLVENPDERARAYQKLEGLVRAELKKRREAADPPTAGNPATVATDEPLTNREVNGATTPNVAEPVFIFRPDGNGFYLEGFGERGHFAANGAKGLYDLFRLIQTPGVPVPMRELDAGPGATRAAGDGQSRQPIIENAELRRLNTDRMRYKAEVDDAENDTERADSQKELDKCIEAIRAMTGLNGKPRDLNNPINKLRPKLWKRIEAARDKIRKAGCGELADHFQAAVRSELGCIVYRPIRPQPKWVVTNL